MRADFCLRVEMLFSLKAVAEKLKSAAFDEQNHRKLTAEIIKCRACPRLVKWREQVAREKRRAYMDDTYWGKPVPGFGDVRAGILIVGLAPAAHGANRTGRMFTGDRSGDWLYDALYRAKLANQPEATGRDDGMKLKNVYITAPVKCAPPANKPTKDEQEKCSAYFARELQLLKQSKVIVALGHLAYSSIAGHLELNPRPAFAHGLEITGQPRPAVICSYHVSQQNTFTGRLTRSMFDKIISRAKILSQK